jgi:hypothetical protein
LRSDTVTTSKGSGTSYNFSPEVTISILVIDDGSDAPHSGFGSLYWFIIVQAILKF